MVFGNVQCTLHGAPGEIRLIEDALKLEGLALREAIAVYLEGGFAVAQALGRGVDHFGSGEPTSLDTLTDGEWVWPGYAAFYVRKYGIAPPQEFVNHVVARGGRCPTLTETEARRVLSEFKADKAQFAPST